MVIETGRGHRELYDLALTAMAAGCFALEYPATDDETLEFQLFADFDEGQRFGFGLSVNCLLGGLRN